MLIHLLIFKTNCKCFYSCYHCFHCNHIEYKGQWELKYFAYIAYAYIWIEDTHCLFLDSFHLSTFIETNILIISASIATGTSLGFFSSALFSTYFSFLWPIYLLLYSSSYSSGLLITPVFPYLYFFNMLEWCLTAMIWQQWFDSVIDIYKLQPYLYSLITVILGKILKL